MENYTNFRKYYVYDRVQNYQKIFNRKLHYNFHKLKTLTIFDTDLLKKTIYAKSSELIPVLIHYEDQDMHNSLGFSKMKYYLIISMPIRCVISWMKRFPTDGLAEEGR